MANVKLLLMRGVRRLRLAVGEEAVTKLIQGNKDERKAMWVKLMKSKDPETLEALADILTGLGIDPDEVGNEEIN